MSHFVEVATIRSHVACILVGVRHRLSVAQALLLVFVVHKNELGHVRVNLGQVKRLMSLRVATTSLIVKQVLFWRVEVARECLRALTALCNGNIGGLRCCRPFDQTDLRVDSRRPLRLG